jgi:hypothetical protein
MDLCVGELTYMHMLSSRITPDRLSRALVVSLSLDPWEGPRMSRLEIPRPFALMPQ